MPTANTDATAAELIDARIGELTDWRGGMLATIRRLVHEADPHVVEEWKWRGVPVWSHDGTVCTGETYAHKVKVTFAHGAALEDPGGLFNASLTGTTRRAIDLAEGDMGDEAAFVALVKAGVAHNVAIATKRPAARARALAGSARARCEADTGAVRLLSGGNPQIAKGDGDAPVAAYIQAMPGWKRAVGERLDAVIVGSVDGVKKAVRWNSPFYRRAGHGYFVSFHCFTEYLKVTFFDGVSLRPEPPVAGKDPAARFLHIYEDGAFDEALVADWCDQAAQLPGWVP